MKSMFMNKKKESIRMGKKHMDLYPHINADTHM